MKTTLEPEQGSPVQNLPGELESLRARVAQLQSRSDALEQVVAAAGLGFAVLTTETAPLRANSLFKTEFGWPPDAEVSLVDLRQRVAAHDLPVFDAAMRGALDEGIDFELPIRAAWPDHTFQTVSLQGRVVNQGLGQQVILTARNISEAVSDATAKAAEHSAALESERERRSVAEAANRGKDQFLSVFSHELRSPLNAILGWNRILAMKRPDDAEVTAVTGRIEHSARAQLKMVNDLLDLARIETGKLRIESRPMQLAKVVMAVVETTRPQAAAKSIDMQVELEPGAGALRGDPDRLQQVVTNLLSNALKFTLSGGTVTLGLRNVDDHVELSVADTGQGIAPELLPHVFDRFRQGDSSSTRHTGGLGLGLALVREIVGLHGGSVAASSPGVGQGAHFVARFPLRKSCNGGESLGARTPRIEVNGTSLTGLSILVVDDELDARTVVAETLKLEGARVTVTDSAVSAFQKVQEAGAHFDIIVTDIGMPEEDGYSLVRRLRSLQVGRRMLAIAVTGYASNTDVTAAMNAGFDLHVPKPVDFNTFVPMVRRLAHK